MVACPNADTRMDYYRRIKEIERRGDQISYAIFDELGHHILTPLRREDIHLLAQSIDDIIDNINGSAKRIAIYNPETKKADRVGFRFEDGKKVRYAKSTGEVIADKQGK